MRNRGVTAWAWAAALAGLAATGGSSGAFYWYGPPERSLINPADRDRPGNPPGSGVNPTGPGVGSGLPPGGGTTSPGGGTAPPSGTPPAVVVNPPGVRPGPGGQPVVPGGGVTPPPPIPGEVKNEPPGSIVIPEPGTFLAAVAGLGTVLAGRAWRGRRVSM